MGVLGALCKKRVVRLPGTFMSFVILYRIACILIFCFIVNSNNENAYKVMLVTKVLCFTPCSFPAAARNPFLKQFHWRPDVSTRVKVDSRTQ